MVKVLDKQSLQYRFVRQYWDLVQDLEDLIVNERDEDAKEIEEELIDLVGRHPFVVHYDLSLIHI